MERLYKRIHHSLLLILTTFIYSKYFDNNICEKKNLVNFYPLSTNLEESYVFIIERKNAIMKRNHVVELDKECHT